MLCLISAHCPLSPGPGPGCWLLLRLGLGRVLLLYSLDLLRCFLGAGGGSVHVYWNGGGGLHTSADCTLYEEISSYLGGRGSSTLPRLLTSMRQGAGAGGGAASGLQS